MSTGIADAPPAALGPAGPPPPPKPRPARALMGAHGHAITPWLLAAGQVPFAFAAHALPGAGPRLLAAAAVEAAVTGAACRQVVKGKRSRRVRRALASAIAAGSTETTAAVLAGPLAGPHHAVLLGLAAGGAAVAGRWRYVAGRPAPQFAAAPEPPRPLAITVREEPFEPLTRFLARFVDGPAAGPFRNARVECEVLRGGFRLTVWFDPDSDATASQVTSTTQGALYTASIAKLYGIAAEQVTIEHLPGTRSEGVAVITVITEQSRIAEAYRWNGVSTYDGKKGTVVTGRYADGADGHWRLHTPHSGAAGGILVGLTGYGKTGALLTLAGEASLAKLCRACGPDRACRRCAMARMCGVWIGDPQIQPFTVLYGKTDLTARGPKACVLMLLWAQAVLKHRASCLSEVEWPDPHGRGSYKGRGWFDPEPRFPELLIVVDEIPLIVKDPALAKLAMPAMSDITQAGRKAGVGLITATPLPDQPYVGDRMTVEMLQAFNVDAFRSDPTSRSMLGIKGDPSKLPMGVKGLSLRNGYDNRPGVHRWKYAPELRDTGDTGVDMHDIAALMASDFIDFGEDVTGAVGPLGYTGHGQVLTDADFDRAMAKRDARSKPQPPVAQPPAAMEKQAALLGGPVSLSKAAAARRALEAAAARNGGTAEICDVMEAIDKCSLGEARDITAALVETGDLVPAGNDEFTMPGGVR